eukprot:symbB.v1.2.014942.t1/scaffold1102.1/size137770/8
MISNNTLPEPSFLHFLCIFARLFSRGCLSIALKVLIVPNVARINSRCKTEASQLKSSLAFSAWRPLRLYWAKWRVEHPITWIQILSSNSCSSKDQPRIARDRSEKGEGKKIRTAGFHNSPLNWRMWKPQ